MGSGHTCRLGGALPRGPGSWQEGQAGCPGQARGACPDHPGPLQSNHLPHPPPFCRKSTLAPRLPLTLHHHHRLGNGRKPAVQRVNFSRSQEPLRGETWSWIMARAQLSPHQALPGLFGKATHKIQRKTLFLLVGGQRYTAPEGGGFIALTGFRCTEKASLGYLMLFWGGLEKPAARCVEQTYTSPPWVIRSLV